MSGYPESSEAAPQPVGGASVAERALGSLFAEVAVLDREGKIVLTNEAWERFARENPADRLPHLGVGANYLKVCRSAAEGAKEVLEGLEEILSCQRRDFSFEYPCHSPTDRRWFLLQATGIDDPPCGAVLLHIDITDRKLLEQRLNEQEERFRIALASSPVVVFNQDRELRYTWINSPVLGWAAKEYLGRTDADIVGGEEGDRLMAIKRGVVENAVGTRVEVPVSFNGETRYFDLNVAPMRDEGGTIVGITCACTDITELKRSAAEREKLIEELGDARRELTKRNLELEGLNKEKTQWLGMAAHDLRNPISSILANCELLMDESTEVGGQPTAELKAIHSCSRFVLELLDDVLDLSAIESGIQRFREEPTDLGSVIREVIILSRPMADDKSIDIEAWFADRIPALALDRQKMTQVFLNLIGNAIKFSQTGAKIQVAVVDEPMNVLVTVRDNGPGIPPDELDSIFAPFQRSRGVSAQPGTGLGLAICKRIIERHEGRIWAENAIDGGAVVHVSIPREMNPSAPLASRNA
jgi:PAS domain S-box-containing protein